MRKLIFAAGVILFFSISGHAGTVSGAKISSLLTDLTGKLFVYLDRNIADSPACGTFNMRYVVDTKAVGSKVQVMQIMEAYTMGRPINAWGAGYCSLQSNTETLNMLESLKLQ